MESAFSAGMVSIPLTRHHCPVASVVQDFIQMNLNLSVISVLMYDTHLTIILTFHIVNFPYQLYYSAGNATECTPCPAGTHGTGPGASECDKCKSGYISGERAAACIVSTFIFYYYCYIFYLYIVSNIFCRFVLLEHIKKITRVFCVKRGHMVPQKQLHNASLVRLDIFLLLVKNRMFCKNIHVFFVLPLTK